ncbi:polysaccharide biosynthesis protein [Clostridium sp. Marseille-P2415]|uniref:polysaccharide biosynthesis protein n=1 Tax=Clostridium sp. Marseille-P2415 TaxID=1805471 RepID=UPI0009884D18|nr:polysaccharide biosynthesis protein [Clostridium sp. Marseille-P2415]
MNDSLKIPQKLSPRKYALLTGTLLLTSAGLITRVLGFFYRIFLSRTIGAEGLGVFNLVHPVFGICFGLCAGSIQTAISRSVAANVRKGRSIFRTGLIISVAISLILAYGIIQFKDFLAINILMEPRCASLLTFIAVSVPCSAIHACINGYYYGMQRPHVPAFAQVMEQTIRIGAVFLIADIMVESGITITVQLAVMGHLIGEIASSLYTIVSYQFFPPKMPADFTTVSSTFRETAPGLMHLALPLMGNRLVLNILASAEAILIPSRLQMSGLSGSAAFSVYGVLTGMALPFILFPSTIFNSLAVLLLPTVAEAQSEGNEGRIGAAISMSLRYCLYVGILCIGIFTLFGNDLGISVFKDKTAGSYMTILAWLCPFLYLVTTMGSILNGLGRTSVTFIQNAIALGIRLCFVLFGIPKFGILAYLVGTLASELLLAMMHVLTLRNKVDFVWNAWDMIVKPAALMILSIGIYFAVFSAADPFKGLPLFVNTAIHIGILCCFYLITLLAAHILRGEKSKKNDYK